MRECVVGSDGCVPSGDPGESGVFHPGVSRRWPTLCCGTRAALGPNWWHSAVIGRFYWLGSYAPVGMSHRRAGAGGVGDRLGTGCHCLGAPRTTAAAQHAPATLWDKSLTAGLSLHGGG